jgi:pyruvate/2-oxoglutarate dehydrogenase complex dihydrolipoamide dehydrogenase (E3) component
MSEQADVIVIGMGPGGENIAEVLAAAGLSVAGIEANLVGGECPYWGCVPSKMMIRASNMLAEARRMPQIAGTAEVTPDWSLVANRIRQEATDNWNDKVAADRFTAKGGRLYRGYGKLVEPDVVEVGNVRLRARKGIVIATGGAPFVPPIPGLDTVDYWTNHEAIEANELPESLIVIGGGTIGVELAQVFARFGVAVTVLEGGDRILSREEPESSAIVAAALAEDGIDVRTGNRVEKVEKSGTAGVTVTFGDDKITAQKILVAVGRKVDLSALGVDVIGQDPNGRSLVVDEHLVAAPGVWAVGDVTGEGAFTHVSMYQSNIVIAQLLGKPYLPAEYHALPRVTFTDPEVGSVGLTEKQARDARIDVKIGTSALENSSRGWIHKAGNAGVIKLIVDAERNCVIGATSTGPTGGEILGLLTLAVQERTTIDRLQHLIYAYPTFHRAIEDALKDL